MGVLKAEEPKGEDRQNHVHIVEAVTHGVGLYVCVQTPRGKPTRRAENTNISPLGRAVLRNKS